MSEANVPEARINLWQAASISVVTSAITFLMVVVAGRFYPQIIGIHEPQIPEVPDIAVLDINEAVMKTTGTPQAFDDTTKSFVLVKKYIAKMAEEGAFVLDSRCVLAGPEGATLNTDAFVNNIMASEPIPPVKIPDLKRRDPSPSPENDPALKREAPEKESYPMPERQSTPLLPPPGGGNGMGAVQRLPDRPDGTESYQIPYTEKDLEALARRPQSVEELQNQAEQVKQLVELLSQMQQMAPQGAQQGAQPAMPYPAVPGMNPGMVPGMMPGMGR